MKSDLPWHPMRKARLWGRLIRFSQAMFVAISTQSVAADPIGQNQSSAIGRVELAQRSAQTIPLVEAAALKYQMDPALLLALIEVESSFQSSAVSSKGARGLMQLMPGTASRYGLRRAMDLHDPATNIEIGTRHLKDLLDASEGNISLALASYNAGQGAIRRSGHTIPAYRETMLYVPAILGRIPHFRNMLHLTQ